MISKLTPEQEAKIPEFIDKWIKIGLDTTQLPDNEIEKIISAFNKKVLRERDRTIHVFPSPYLCWEFICKKIGQKMDFVYPYCNGSFDSYYFAWIDFMMYIGVTGFPDGTKEYMDTSKVGFIFPFDDFIAVSQKPCIIKKVGNDLHCETGPALAYNDGISEWYYLNGIRMKKEHIMTPAEKISPQDILKETNAEVRRELLRKVGVERFLEVAKHKVLEKKDNYELLSIELSPEVTDARYLKMQNPSVGCWHVEGVAPECSTVQEALNWRAHHDKNKQWKPEILT